MCVPSPSLLLFILFPSISLYQALHVFVCPCPPTYLKRIAMGGTLFFSFRCCSALAWLRKSLHSILKRLWNNTSHEQRWYSFTLSFFHYVIVRFFFQIQAVEQSMQKNTNKFAGASAQFPNFSVELSLLPLHWEKAREWKKMSTRKRKPFVLSWRNWNLGAMRAMKNIKRRRLPSSFFPVDFLFGEGEGAKYASAFFFGLSPCIHCFPKKILNWRRRYRRNFWTRFVTVLNGGSFPDIAPFFRR